MRFHSDGRGSAGCISAVWRERGGHVRRSVGARGRGGTMMSEVLKKLAVKTFHTYECDP